MFFMFLGEIERILLLLLVTVFYREEIFEFFYILLISNMEVNILAFIATALFILIPTAFLIVLYVQTESQTN
jgi:photosystem II PsbM protein